MLQIKRFLFLRHEWMFLCLENLAMKYPPITRIVRSKLKI
jgi:hypothetical protein